MRKKSTATLLFSLTLIILSASSLLVSAGTNAVTASLSYATASAGQNQISAVFPSAGTSSACGTTFNASVAGNLTMAIFYAAKYGAGLTFTIEGRLYGVNADTTNSTLLATSTNHYHETDLATYTTDAGAFTDAIFYFDGTYGITQYSKYSIVVVCTAGDLSIANKYIVFRCNTANAYAGGSKQTYSSSAWASGGSDDVGFMVVVDTTLSTPAPTAAPTPTATETFINNSMGYVASLLFILIPAFLCWYAAGGWGFFIGINIGVILSYLILGATFMPIWAIVLVGIMDIALLFGKVGLGVGGGRD